MQSKFKAKLRALAWAGLKQVIRWRFPAVQQLSPADLAERLQLGSPLLLLDTRSASEFAVSHLQGAQHRPTLEAALQQISPHTPVVTYCSIGYRSSRVAQQLQAQGYPSVYNLEGSIFEWMNQGYPVFQQGQMTQAVHPYSFLWKGLLNPTVGAATEPAKPST
ncbi:MAG: rhodanese-like domain-containing protein [Leptolyngbyaceae cyanobacterium SM1_1_3]|nr:rhodanese-like domain-containing protein [Leptolyngbyaceae cyanobacterium SM1_1_3]NJN02065.1 rhodanese-like domain-containing protein [Leptolyngbyaceae cyanobacterium RM1_1_2]NJO09236.1 rhodanese-like domain-containing protein [Leptolyngbyaceae cyanobacterium SL_1_1]